MATSPATAKPAAGTAPKKTPVKKPAAVKRAVPAKKPVAAKKPVVAKKPVAAKAVKPKAAKPAKAEKPVKALKPAKPVALAEAPKLKKSKLVRDSFSMPEPEYAVLGSVKKACLKAGVEVKKSELLRIGVALISKMDVDGLKAVLATLPPLKAGRPKSK